MIPTDFYVPAHISAIIHFISLCAFNFPKRFNTQIEVLKSNKHMDTT